MTVSHADECLLERMRKSEGNGAGKDADGCKRIMHCVFLIEMFIDTTFCAWCDNELSDYFVHGCKQSNDEEVCFCNLVCAKHFNDLVEKVTLDIEKYTEYFNDKKLDKLAEKIYKMTYQRGWEFMPMIYDVRDPRNISTRRAMVQYYIDKVYDKN